MISASPIMCAASKALRCAAFEVRCGRFDTASFFTVLSGAKFQIASERKYLKTAKELSVVLDRGEALYFSLLSAFENKKQIFASTESEVYRTSANLSIRSFLLFDNAISQGEKASFVRKADILRSDIEKFCTASRLYRFRALSRNGSITKALFEIEFICMCTDAAERCLRLIGAYNRLLYIK